VLISIIQQISLRTAHVIRSRGLLLALAAATCLSAGTWAAGPVARGAPATGAIPPTGATYNAVLTGESDQHRYKFYVARPGTEGQFQVTNTSASTPSPTGGEINFRFDDENTARVVLRGQTGILSRSFAPGRYFLVVQAQPLSDPPVPYILTVSPGLGTFAQIRKKCRNAKQAGAGRKIKLYCRIPR
jgi:hypothetical protein